MKNFINFYSLKQSTLNPNNNNKKNLQKNHKYQKTMSKGSFLILYKNYKLMILKFKYGLKRNL